MRSEVMRSSYDAVPLVATAQAQPPRPKTTVLMMMQLTHEQREPILILIYCPFYENEFRGHGRAPFWMCFCRLRTHPGHVPLLLAPLYRHHHRGLCQDMP